MIRRRHTLALGLGLLAPLPQANAQQRPQPPLPQTTVRAVASFSILADLVQEVGGPRVGVRSLVPVGQDLHRFQPSPSDVRGVTDAGVFVINGLGLEGWAERIAQAARFKGKRVVATKGLQALPAGHKHAKKGAGKSHAHGAHDIETPRSGHPLPTLLLEDAAVFPSSLKDARCPEVSTGGGTLLHLPGLTPAYMSVSVEDN